MKRILVTGAGGTPATNFIRSLSASSDEYFIVGTDSDKYCLRRSKSILKKAEPQLLCKAIPHATVVLGL